MTAHATDPFIPEDFGFSAVLRAESSGNGYYIASRAGWSVAFQQVHGVEIMRITIPTGELGDRIVYDNGPPLSRLAVQEILIASGYRR